MDKMKRSLQVNYFDILLRERYNKHTIPPEKELWENINSKVSQKKLIVYSRRILRLRIAATILAFALIGTTIRIATDLHKQKNPITDLNMQKNSTNDLNSSGVPADTISEKPLNSVRNVAFSDQEQEEQDMLEFDNYLDDDDESAVGR